MIGAHSEEGDRDRVKYDHSEVTQWQEHYQDVLQRFYLKLVLFALSMSYYNEYDS